MNAEDALQQHRRICDELYELALEENRFLQQFRRAPEAEFIERKRQALGRLDEALEALRAAPAGNASRDPRHRAALEKAQSRIMQILQLDRENEQLLMRHSLSRSTPAPPGPEPGLLKKIYSRNF